MKYQNNLLLAFLTIIVFVAPSFLFSLIEASYSIYFEVSFLIFLVLAVCLAFSPNKIAITVLIAFVIMELIQFAHLSYYKFPISANTIGLIWSERGEILESGLGDLQEIWYFPFVVLIPYGILIALYLKLKRITNIWLFVPLILIFSYLPYKILFQHSNATNNAPVSSRISILNSLRTFSYFLFNRNTIAATNYQPYSYEINPTDNINVVLVFGESVNANYMSLFGYPDATSPLLDDIKDSLIYKKALSAAPLTLVSSSMFFNATREYDNVNNQLKGTVNLFKLAKENGFTTSYLSAQEENIASKIQPQMIDNITTKEDIYLHLKEKSDLYLLELLEKEQSKFLNPSTKNFLVLHQRNIHSPYKANYEHYPQFNIFTGDGGRENTYKNALIMNDYFLYHTMQLIKNIAGNKPTYVFFTADHGEALGKNGEFGHGFLDTETVQVPFVYTCFNCQLEKDDSLTFPTHYEIAKMIANKLGAHIINPNENGLFYINGSSLYGDDGFWTVEKKDNQAKITTNDGQEMILE
jgi:glucan phosphoethanolaminetransferase (alkaline phosphatase superfamily)